MIKVPEIVCHECDKDLTIKNRRNTMQIMISEEAVKKAVQQEYFNKREASNYLGISMQTFKTWREKFKIPYQSIDGMILFARKDLETFMNEHKR